MSGGNVDGSALWRETYAADWRSSGKCVPDWEIRPKKGGAFSEQRGGGRTERAANLGRNAALPFVRSGCSPAEPDWFFSISPQLWASRAPLRQGRPDARKESPAGTPLCSENALSRHPGTQIPDEPSLVAYPPATTAISRYLLMSYRQAVPGMRPILPPGILPRFVIEIPRICPRYRHLMLPKWAYILQKVAELAQFPPSYRP